MSKYIFIVIAILSIGGIVYLGTSKNSNEEINTENEFNNETEVAIKEIKNTLLPMPEEKTNAPQKAIISNYTNYSDANIKDLVNEGKKPVIFFHANWCPTCRALDKNIEDNQANLGDVVVLRADFDSETKLKQKYNVVAQHTLVQVDANGMEVTKWVGGNTVETITKQVQ